MTNEELIAALEAAPVGTRELGVAVLEAVGATPDGWGGLWFIPSDDEEIAAIETNITIGAEARVVTDLNFRLPDVPEGLLVMSVEPGQAIAHFSPAALQGDEDGPVFTGTAHTERLARCIAELKAVLAMKGEK